MDDINTADALSGVRWVAIGTLVSRGLGLLTIILVARILGPKEMGIIAIVVLVKEFSSLLSEFGLSDAIIHHQGLTSQQLATLYTINWIMGIAAFTASSLLSWPASEIFGHPILVYLIPVASIGFLINPAGQQVGVLLRKSMNFRATTMIEIGTSVTSLIVAVVGVHSGLGIWSLVYSGLAGNIAQQTLLLYLGIKKNMLYGFSTDISIGRDLLSFGAYRTCAMSLNMLNSRMDQLIVGATLGTSALGVYSMASRWTLMTMQQINGIATKVAFPAIARIQNDRVRVRNAFLRLTNRVCTVNAAFFLDWRLQPNL